MKSPLYIIAAIALIFQSCGSENATKAEAGKTQEKAPKTEMADPAHSSMSALDWTGTYSGVLPCDDCDEVQAEVTLEEKMRYSRKLVYKGKSNTPLLSSGLYEWNESGTEITLKSFKGNHQVFRVGENKLVLVSADGGEYALTKEEKSADEEV